MQNKITQDEARANLLAMGLDELKGFIAGLGMAGYRAGQLARWLYVSGASSFEEMTNVSKADRELLSSSAVIRGLDVMDVRTSSDGTRKLLFGLDDGERVESVLIPEEDRLTLCISSQAGCALGCRFCLTGAGGYRRDLLPHEITGQVMAARRIAAPDKLTSIVLMGMGEPLLNADNVFEALRRLVSPKMFDFSTRRITLSTAGVVPGLKALGDSGIGVNIAVSLNAADDRVRDMVMPINKKYPIKELMAALRAFPLAPRRRITIEYVLLRGVNDSVEDAAKLARLLRGLPCKVNLIPFNEHPGSDFKRPSMDAVLRFQDTLKAKEYTAFIRDSKGTDILAACGQLRAEYPEGEGE